MSGTKHTAKVVKTMDEFELRAAKLAFEGLIAAEKNPMKCSAYKARLRIVEVALAKVVPS